MLQARASREAWTHGSPKPPSRTPPSPLRKQPCLSHTPQPLDSMCPPCLKANSLLQLHTRVSSFLQLLTMASSFLWLLSRANSLLQLHTGVSSFLRLLSRASSPHMQPTAALAQLSWLDLMRSRLRSGQLSLAGRQLHQKLPIPPAVLRAQARPCSRACVRQLYDECLP